MQEHYHLDFPAPFVTESPIKIGLQFEEEQYIRCNDTRLVVGKVVHLLLPEAAIAEDGDVALAQLDSTVIGGLDSYYSVEPLGRYPYATV